MIFTVSNSSAADVTITSKVVSQGKNFDLNISIDPLGIPITGTQLNIDFNQSLFRVNSITEGNIFKQIGANTFFNGGTINNSLGTVANIYDTIIGPFSVYTPGTFIIINATPNSSSGSSWINLSNIIISDPNGIAVPLNMTNGSITINTPPVLATIGNKTVNENQVLAFTVSASDADGDTLTYSASNLPSGATFDSATKTFLWTPNFNQGGTYQNVHFEVSDGTLIDFENIKITVK